jgi:hypothetical protein
VAAVLCTGKNALKHKFCLLEEMPFENISISPSLTHSSAKFAQKN